jgi:hypothetical protein
MKFKTYVSDNGNGKEVMKLSNLLSCGTETIERDTTVIKMERIINEVRPQLCGRDITVEIRAEVKNKLRLGCSFTSTKYYRISNCQKSEYEVRICIFHLE